MKFKIIFGVVMAIAFISVYTIINAIAGGISDNQAGLNRLNQSFLSLNEEFDSVSRQTDLIKSTRESYRNSLVDLADRVFSMEKINEENKEVKCLR